MKWDFRLDRTPKGNVVQLRCGALVVRIPQRVVQEMVDALFPVNSTGILPDAVDYQERWDVRGWEDLFPAEREQLRARYGAEWR